VLAAAAVAMQADTADLAVIVERQDRFPNAMLPWLAVSFVVSSSLRWPS
jgi:P2-related tail formation protein